jgi:hypothetical protein
MIGGLQEPMTVKLFISEDLQFPDHNLEQRVRDLLQDYENANPQRFKFEIVHPSDEEEAPELGANPTPEDLEKQKDAQKALEEGPRGFGIQKVPTGVRGKDEVVLRNVYKGMAIVLGDKVEVINELKGTDNLEYEISKRVKVLVSPETARHKIGFVRGFGGPADSPQFLESLNGAFEQIYGDLVKGVAVNLKDDKTLRGLMVDCKTLPLDQCPQNPTCQVPPSIQELQSKGQPLPAQVCYDGFDALVLLNPDDTFTPSAKFAIDQFLMRGKGVAWMQSTTKVNEQMPMLPSREPVVTGLEELFGAYGITLQRDLILDRENNIVSLILTEKGLAQISNPSMPLTRDINAESSMTKDVPLMSFPMASSLTISESVRTQPGVILTELVRTEPEAVSSSKITMVDYADLVEPKPDEKKGPFVLAASLQGTIKSFWADKPKPASEPASSPSDPPLDFPEPIKQAPEGARIVVFGNGEFMFPNEQSGYSRQYSGMGALLMLNTFDWLVQDEGLVSIRSKGLPRVIKNVEPPQHSTIQFANIVGVPLSFALFGLGFWLWRRKRRDALSL